jgi:16S rRNA (adenine1518-N6/adenine1519-N6)-dimethyltransferase
MGDILASKNKLDPVVLDKWRAGAALYGCTRFKLVANLPYSVATPVLINLILSEIPIERLVGMVQFETAEKISADVGSEAYSGLAVLAQSLSDCRIIRRVPPTVFHPRPKVDSAILEMIPNSQKRSVLCNALSTSNEPNIGPYRFRVFLRDLFLHRRKALRAALVKMPLGAQIPKEMLDQLITRLKLPMQIRADQMTHTQLIELSKGWWEIKNQFDPQELSSKEDLIIDS